MPADPTIRWLLDGDPAIRWQVLRDLAGAAQSTDLGLPPTNAQGGREGAKSASQA